MKRVTNKGFVKVRVERPKSDEQEKPVESAPELQRATPTDDRCSEP